MVLYEIYQGVITAMSVLRESEAGWRQHNNGFIKKRSLSSNVIDLGAAYYTTDKVVATHWQQKVIDRMHDVIQVSLASKSDLEFWVSQGCDESNLPKSRYR